MSLFDRLSLLGIALLAAAVSAGCESKSKREFMQDANPAAQTVPPAPVSMTDWKHIIQRR
ncbi:hypothetical protein SFB21_2165 [Acinetobacter bouvetii]|uniref:Uncharacterized protein n=1 Tax=Acinetobacter bouvetii TaxID=202951 RepID=A0A811GE19_9GAMM|nr:hypothetical protein [Acinetobacter bouvetii]CAB1217916.1 hypothetical protein SFB21_2165 [Acinetobacter bouvetii]